MDKLGQFLKSKRKYAGLTQEQAAERLEVTVITIQNWKKGRYLPRIEKWDSIADVYQVSKKELSQAMCCEENERKDNWPDFLFEEETNNIINELHLNRNQQELFGLLNIYNEDFVRSYGDTQNIIDDNIDLKKIPYMFINQVGSINITNLADGLRRVLYEVRPDFLLKYLRKNPEEEFNVRKMSKEDICEFISNGCQDHMYEELEGLCISGEYYPCLYIHANLLEIIENMQCINDKGGEIYWCNVVDENSIPKWITYDNIPADFSPKLMEKVFKTNLNQEYRDKNRAYDVRDRLGLLDVKVQQGKEGLDVYIFITPKGRKCLEWYNT